jgi:hypothetical protein
MKRIVLVLLAAMLVGLTVTGCESKTAQDEAKMEKRPVKPEGERRPAPGPGGGGIQAGEADGSAPDDE